MSLAVILSLILVAAGLGPECTAQDTDWISELDLIKNDKIDKNWQEYVDKLGGEFEEQEVPKKTTTKDKEYHKDPLDWNPTSPGDVPFLAILFTKDNGPSDQYKDFFRGEPDPGISHIEPHKACGGALLSPSHVLTVCGCLSNLISEKIFKQAKHLFGINDETPQFNIKNQSSKSDPTRVFVSLNHLWFTPDETHEVDYNKANWPQSDDLNCNKLIKTNGGTTVPGIRAHRADGELIVLPFKNGPEVAIYPSWPPPVTVDPEYKEFVTVASIGMRLTEKINIIFSSSISMSSLKLKHCGNSTGYCSPAIYKLDTKEIQNTNPDKQTTHKCFCPMTTDQQAQLVGGVIGWPVLDNDGNLIGLTATERRSADGTLVVAIINSFKRKLIEAYIGERTLKNLDTPHIQSALFRDKDLANEYWIYDYLLPNPRDPRGKSGVTKLGINTSLFIPTIYSIALLRGTLTI